MLVVSRKVIKQIRWLLKRHFRRHLLATQLENLFFLVFTILHGKSMKIAELSRRWPVKTKFHYRQRRLLRFLANRRIVVAPLFDQLLTMILARVSACRDHILVIIDETDLPNGYQGLVASIPFLGRALHFAFSTFHHGAILGSQNQIENDFFVLIRDLLKLHGLAPIFLLDRGYADVKIMRFLKQLSVDYVIRVGKQVWVELPGYRGRLSGLQQIGDWQNVRYQQKVREPVSLHTCWGKDKSGKPEMIYLITNRGPEIGQFSYQLRMWIEEGFRDTKSTFGLNEVWLKVDIEERLGRLVFGVMLSTIVAAYLYDRARSYAQDVTKHLSDLSFVRLVVEVYRSIWFAGRWTFG
jgi:Transposase DDE domain